MYVFFSLCSFSAVQQPTTGHSSTIVSVDKLPRCKEDFPFYLLVSFVFSSSPFFFSSYFFFFCSFNFFFYSIALFCFVRKNKQKTHRTWKDDQAEISELTFHVVSMEFHSSRKKKIIIILQGIIFMLIGMGINVSRQWLRTS